jgi:hypothetical protein
LSLKTPKCSYAWDNINHLTDIVFFCNWEIK